MMRALKLAIRRWLLRSDLRDPALPADIPPALEKFAVGESFPLKGVWFTVGKIVGGPFPVLIVFPKGQTRGAKLKGLRDMRDTLRHARDLQRETRKALRQEAS